MNHLGHLYLADNNRELMAGAFLGDFVKGSLTGKRPLKIEVGIRFHRAVDAYVDAHPSQRLSISRFEPEFRRFGGIVCDVVYDHFLARHWCQFSDQAFNLFCQQAYAEILDQHAHLEPQAAETITRMRNYGSLEAYHSEDYIERSLNHIATRISRANPLDRAFQQYQAHARDLEQDFFTFMPDVKAFARQWIKAEARLH